MSKEMVISANPHETRVAILEEGQLCEFYVEREKEFALVGSIYKGRVTRVLPGMQSAFVEIGLDSDAFLYVSDFLEDLEEFDHIVTTADEKVQKMQDQGGQVFSAAAPSAGAGTAGRRVGSASLRASIACPARRDTLAHEFSASGRTPGNVAPPYSAPPSNRPRYENRTDSRPNRGGGRDFRGGGGGGRGGGRPDPGRGGRGGGRGGDRRFGRELPQSKYASHRPHDDSVPESAPARGLRTDHSSRRVSREVQGAILCAVRCASGIGAAIDPGELSAGADARLTFARAACRPVRSEYPAASYHEPSRASPPRRSTRLRGLEPLPGESVAKWKNREPLHKSST